MVITPHDFNYKRFNTFSLSAREQIDRQMPGWLRRSRVIVVSSEFIASELRQFYPEFAGRVRVVRPGVPTVPDVPDSTAIEAYKTRVGLPKQFLLMPNWIVPHKNQKVLFEALGLLKQKGICIPVVLVGPNSHLLRPENKRRARGYVREVLDTAQHWELRHGSDFWSLGYVADFELECLYRLATALVLPTLYEAGSFQIREAVRAGCPVICSRISALEEEVKLANYNATLFDPHNAHDLAESIQHVLAHPAEAAQRVEQARKLISHIFDWRKTASGYLKAFEDVLRSN